MRALNMNLIHVLGALRSNFYRICPLRPWKALQNLVQGGLLENVALKQPYPGLKIVNNGRYVLRGSNNREGVDLERGLPGEKAFIKQRRVE